MSKTSAYVLRGLRSNYLLDNTLQLDNICSTGVSKYQTKYLTVNKLHISKSWFTFTRIP